MTKRNEVAAYFHRRMCEDARFGYTQGAGRWGSGAVEDWECQGVTGHFRVGDRDCSSSTIDCWQEALRGSKYEGALDGATYTGDMRRVFVGSGLFEWMPMSFIAQPGDLYLSEAHHVAMCQSQHPDILSEFMLNEHGTITGGKVGDQTGMESVVRGFWWPSFGWDGILHYNGKADTEDDIVDQVLKPIWMLALVSAKVCAKVVLAGCMTQRTNLNRGFVQHSQSLIKHDEFTLIRHKFNQHLHCLSSIGSKNTHKLVSCGFLFSL